MDTLSFITNLRTFLLKTAFHAMYFDHGSPRPLPDPSQLLTSSTPSLFSLSLCRKQTDKQNKQNPKLEFLNNQRKKTTRNKHTHKHHINTKSETIIHKQRTRTFSAFLPEARHLPSFLPAQNLERPQSLYGCVALLARFHPRPWVNCSSFHFFPLTS